MWGWEDEEKKRREERRERRLKWRRGRRLEMMGEKKMKETHPESIVMNSH